MSRRVPRLTILILLVAFTTASRFAWAEPVALAAQQNTVGQVTVKVTPLTVPSDASSWRFEILLSTHVVPLTQDLAEVSTLSGNPGTVKRALAWEGDPPGGHHRKGILSFEPINPRPNAITLTIRGIGSVAERRFVWSLSP